MTAVTDPRRDLLLGLLAQLPRPGLLSSALRELAREQAGPEHPGVRAGDAQLVDVSAHGAGQPAATLRISAGPGDVTEIGLGPAALTRLVAELIATLTPPDELPGRLGA